MAKATRSDLVGIQPELREALGDGELVKVLKTNVTLAEINAGKVILPEKAGVQIRVYGFKMRVVGSNFGGATAITLTDTSSSPVSVASITIGTFDSNAIVNEQTSGVTLGNGWMAPNAAGKGLKIGKSGSSATNATSLDVMILYSEV